jgi:hypothetical protein
VKVVSVFVRFDATSPDKQHTAVVTAIMPLMKKGSTAYSHGFNIVEECKFVKTLLLLYCAQNVLIGSS